MSAQESSQGKQPTDQTTKITSKNFPEQPAKRSSRVRPSKSVSMARTQKILTQNKDSAAVFDNENQEQTVDEAADEAESNMKAQITHQPDNDAQLNVEQEMQARPEMSEQAPDVEAPEQEQTDTGRIMIPVPSVVRARERGKAAAEKPVVLQTQQLTKTYGNTVAANNISMQVHEGSFTGVVGPNGAGKTTTLSMISGLNRPSSGRVLVRDVNVWADGSAAKRLIGTLPDRLRLFDRLTGAQLLIYSGVLHGLDESTVQRRASDLAEAFGLDSALDRLVADYSAGMQKKIALACSMIHAPQVLVLDEPFETIDPVSAANVTEILEKFVAGGGSVIMSSHSLDLIQRVCDHVVVIVEGDVIAQGTVDQVRGGMSLEEKFAHLTTQAEGGRGLDWLHGSSDSD